MIRAAVIGLGRWGRNHVRAVQAPQAQPADAPPSSAIRFTRAVVQTPEKSQAFADGHGIELGTDFAAVLADPQIDAVVLATPNSRHPGEVIACARAGKAVLCEKPLALTLAQAREAVDACIRAGVVLTVGQDKRRWPSMDALAEVVASGALGPLLHAEGHFSNENTKNFQTSWREQPEEAPAASLTGTGIHVLDAFIRMFGPLDTVFAQQLVLAPAPALQDTLSLLLRFRQPLSAVLCGVRSTPLFWRAHVFGRDGSAEAIGERELLLRRSGGLLERRTFEPVNALRLQLETFAAAVARGGAAAAPESWPIPPQQLLATVAAVEAVAIALREGAVVRAPAV
jgi:predicted dehydrogenase